MRDLKLTEVSEKVDTLITLVRLVALLLIQGKKQTDQFIMLSKAGFQPKEIAEMVGTTPNTVRVALSRLRKQHGIRFTVKSEDTNVSEE